MTETCGRTRELLGPYLLSHLDERDRIAFEAHMEGCDVCQGERDSLAPVAGLLPAMDPSRLSERTPAPPDLGHRVFDRIEEERAARRTRRRRMIGLGAAAAVLAAAVPIVLLLGGEGAEEVAFHRLPRGVSAAATVEARPWGTEIWLQVEGLPGGQEYGVWMEDRGGDRVAAGTFRAVPGRQMDMVLASGLPRPAAIGLGVSDQQGETLLYAWMPEASPKGER